MQITQATTDSGEADRKQGRERESAVTIQLQWRSI